MAAPELYTGTAPVARSSRVLRERNLTPKRIDRQTADLTLNPWRASREIIATDEGFGSSYRFRTLGQGTWTVQVNYDPKTIPHGEGNSERMHEIMWMLDGMQSTKKPPESEWPHTKSIDFVIQNCPRLAPVMGLTNGDKFFPRSFVEVNFGAGKGQADLVIVASNGSIHILEFGRRDKDSQVRGYAKEMRKLVPDSNLKIIPLVAYYELSNETQDIRFSSAIRPDVEEVFL